MLKTELDLFLFPPTQTAFEKGYFVEYHPIANIRDGIPVEFNISGNGEDYIDLSSSYLYTKVKITKSDGSALTAEDRVAPVSLFSQALFSQVDVSLNERVISSASNTYPYRAYIETLLNFEEDAKKSLLQCECFYKDQKLGTRDFTLDDNPGLKKRYELTKNSNTLDMMSSLHCDIFQQNRLLLNTVDFKIKMIHSKPEFCLMALKPSDSSQPDPDYKLVLEHASLFIRKVKINAGVLLGQLKGLEKTSAIYPIDRVLCKTYSMQDNVFLGSVPKRIIIGLLENGSITIRFYTDNTI